MDAASEANLYRNYEHQRFEATYKRPVLPVTLITGFLGAGKTTLLRNILRLKHNLRIAVLVNEYGEVDHDGAVIDRDKQTDNVVKLAGGCLCCTASLSEAMELSIWRMLQEPERVGSSGDMYDCLVLETSGVTDPETVVQALDRKFGKLTRARQVWKLDSVVVVVDGDHFLHLIQSQLGPGEDSPGLRAGMTARAQLESADVVVVNKRDLLDEEQLLSVLKTVSAVNPGAAVHSCSYGDLPLHYILDVEASRVDLQGVSHERAETHLFVSPGGGNLRKTKMGHKRSTPVVENPDECERECNLSDSCNRHHHRGGRGGGGKGHLERDRMEEVTFTSDRALYLSRFQDWVCTGLPEGVLRAKGVLAFQEDRATRAVFNMSGRRRMSFETDGQWEGPLSLHLVVIGMGLDREKILEGLRYCQAPHTKHWRNSFGCPLLGDKRLKGEVNWVSQMLREDPLFDLVGLEEGASDGITADHGLIRFRFTGSGVFAMTASQLSTRHGVNLDAVNRAIMRAVNSGDSAGTTATTTTTTTRGASVRTTSRAGTPSRDELEGGRPLTGVGGGGVADREARVFLTCEKGIDRRGEECLVLRYALGGRVSLEAGWGRVSRVARKVMGRDLSHVGLCNCRS
ncbi:unnamed protein product [Discosporangium mesarthrocarpum]